MADEQNGSRDQRLVARLLSLKTGPGAEVRKIAREMFPDINLPDDPEQVIAPVRAELDGVKAELGDAQKQLKDALDRITARERADSDMQSQIALETKINAARSKFNLTDSGKDKMLARMQETGNVVDPEAAAAWVVSQTPRPEPASSPSWLPEASNLFGSQKQDDAWAALHKDPRKYLDDQLREFVKDPERYTAETFGSNA